ncbi:MAG: hypothetical protein IJ864_02595 [Alphaproteobacteria bacterium]|nr:hypothetical protein [Alphaproteobacteria bacterium]
MSFKIKRSKKLVRVLKRKWFKPALYTLGLSFLIYITLSSAVTEKKRIEHNTPHFIITRVTDRFDEVEFMHLLLTIQEINIMPKASTQLIEYLNSKNADSYPKFLAIQLNRMNWAPQAFWSRAQKLFSMTNTYEHLLRIDETINFLTEELTFGRLPSETKQQIELLRQEKEKILTTELSPEEFTFIKEYAGIIQNLKKN